MATMTAFDDIVITIEDYENELLSTIPILPGGMVDVALSEFGASIVDVFLDGVQSPADTDELVDSTTLS